MKFVGCAVINGNGQYPRKNNGQYPSVGEPIKIVPVAFKIRNSHRRDASNLHFNILTFLWPARVTILEVAIELLDSPIFPSLVLLARLMNLYEIQLNEMSLCQESPHTDIYNVVKKWAASHRWLSYSAQEEGCAYEPYSVLFQPTRVEFC